MVNRSKRYAESIAGDLGAQIESTGGLELTVVNPRGDAVTSVEIPAGQVETTPATAITAWSDYTEYGAPTEPASAATVGGPAGYAFLGGKQRSTSDATAGLTLMGDRLYNSVRGLFTSLDPEPGGNENAYTYPNDPINAYDLDGHYSYMFNYSVYWARSRVSAERVMTMVRRHFGRIFPFRSSCATLRLGAVCKLNPGANPVKVVSLRRTSFMFISLPGHVEGPWKYIWFFFTRTVEAV